MGDNSNPAGQKHRPLDIERIRNDFPILGQRIHGKPLVYLDNAATTQKPRPVIEALTHYYSTDNSNVHRGVHLLSQRATRAFEDARKKTAKFINAENPNEIIFVRGATEGINLVAHSFGRCCVGKGGEVLITGMEHHSNIVPWQILCDEIGARLRVAPINKNGELCLDEFEKLLTSKTRLVSVVHMSNSLGTINPVKEIIARAHAKDVPVLIDGAQAAPHINVDVQDLDCDFYTFSSHKMYGPMGIGALYGKSEILETMPPYQGGGDMISMVTFEETTYNSIPHKFEAGTPNVAGAIGFGAAIDYVESIGLNAIAEHENDLVGYATGQLLSIPGIRLIGTAANKAGIVSFVMEGVHPHDIGTILDREGIAIRSGHHCTQPVMDFFEIPATSRASFGMYNTRAEVDALVAAIEKVKEMFA